MDSRYVPDLLHRPDGPSGDRPAIVSADGEMSYRELWHEVAAITARLASAGVEPGDYVALHLPRSATYVTSLIAVMTMGAAAVPMDPELPVERLLQMADATKPKVIVHAADGRFGAPDEARWLRVDTGHRDGVLDSGTFDATPQAAWRERPAAERTAMVLFTTGSADRPKGVLLHHAGLCNRLEWGHRYFGLTSDDRVLHKASSSFDAAIHEIFAPLIAGGTLVIGPPGIQFDSLGILRLIRDASVTTAHFVPSMLRYVVEEESLPECTSLRRVLCGGEALDMTLVRRFRERHPAALYNGYGPTETSVNVTYWNCDEPFSGDIAPIGRPIDGVTCHVLDEDMAPVPAGRIGELWISGIAVSGGYLDDPELTRQRFRPNTLSGDSPFVYRTGDLSRLTESGCLEFHGRIDDQVKVRGERVAPEEVSTVIRSHPQVRDAAVIGVPDAVHGTRLVAYVVAQRAHSPLVDGLPRVQLPNGMIVATPTPDEAMFLYRQIFEQDEYSRFGHGIGAGAVVVDVGANIGLFSLWASQQAEGVRVLAVEPNPDVLPYLRINLEMNQVVSEVVPLAVTDTTGTALLTSFHRLSYLSGLGEGRQQQAIDLVDSHYRRASAGRGGRGPSLDEISGLRREAEERLEATRHEVRTADLSTIFDRSGLDRVDLLKINAEGAELAVIRGVRPEHWQMVRQVCLEVERASSAGPEIKGILANAGFTVHEIDDWNVGSDADVTYVYGTRASGPPAPEAKQAPPRHRGGLLTVRDIRDHVRTRLRPAMRPSHIIFLEDLPRFPNGKVSRRELPLPAPVPVPAGDAAAGVGEELRRMWCEALSVDHVSDDDDFIGLGGHSLIALRITARVRRLLNTETSPSSLLRPQTFAAWRADVLQEAQR
ncbi:amino acid adenylation domain-containing protein [Saccharothrix coeruleofusca]|uniref:amino acid adenylation domain-containing protein n=1 Tax=Saccharothrix coeruleofusca TaxID=33919 RepID=UPI0027DE7638|nr:amino acid adenylation domain-containing protein [Saccharothrix coeruleofusca]